MIVGYLTINKDAQHHQIPNNFPNYLFSKISLLDIKFPHFKNKSTFIFLNSFPFFYKFHSEFIFQKYLLIYDFQIDSNIQLHFIFKKIKSQNVSFHFGKVFPYLFKNKHFTNLFIFNTWKIFDILKSILSIYFILQGNHFL